MNQTEWSVIWNGFPKRLLYEVFPSDKRFVCFADSSSNPWNPPTIFRPDLIPRILRECLSSFCELFFQQFHLFLICEVLTCNDSRIIPREIFQIPENCQCKWLLVSTSAPRTFASFSGFLVKIRLDPLGGQVLHHDCTSMIVSRFTTFTVNFVICCYLIAKDFCTRYGSAFASSARGPCTFGPLTDLAISVFREVSINTVFTKNAHFSEAWAPEMVHKKNWLVSLFVQEPHHPRDFLWILAAIPAWRNLTSLSVLKRGLRFYLFLEFFVGLVNGSLRSFLSTCFLDTETG